MSKHSEALIIGGANGSGKTTFSKKLLDTFNYEFLNADVIAKQLNPQDLSKARIKAGKKFLQKGYDLIESDNSFVIETTLAGHYIGRICKLLAAKHYIITIIFISLESPQVCINRINERILKGEHYVPEEDVIRRFFRGKNNFWNKYRFIADQWHWIDNTSSNFQEVAFGVKDEYTVSNETLFKIFLEDIRSK